MCNSLWFQLSWPSSWALINIAVKELVPVVVAAALCGHHWRGAKVCFHSDNLAVVAILCMHPINKGPLSAIPIALLLLLHCLLSI